MSKTYDELIISESIINSLHLKNKIGPRMSLLVEAIQHQLDELYLSIIEIIRDSIQINNAFGLDLDRLGSLFNIVRFAGENDENLRSRILVYVVGYSAVTKDAILDLFEGYTGRKPYFEEPFHIRIYKPTDEIEQDQGGAFTLLFELPRDRYSEKIKVESDGTSLVVSSTNIVSPATATVSETTSITSGDTTIYLSSVTGFNTPGYAKIDNEWISYESTQTSPAALLSCGRGYWDSVATTHNTATNVVEGSTLVWKEGSNNQAFSLQNGQTVYLSGGPYDVDTWFDVQYYVTGLGSGFDVNASSSTDEWSDFGTRMDRLAQVGVGYKAAGVKSTINIGSVLRNWFQDTGEELSISESFNGDVGYGYLMPWYSSGGTQTTLVITLPGFDEWKVVSCLWDMSHWDQSSWDTEASDPSGDFVLKISASYNP